MLIKESAVTVRSTQTNKSAISEEKGVIGAAAPIGARGAAAGATESPLQNRANTVPESTPEFLSFNRKHSADIIKKSPTDLSRKCRLYISQAVLQ